MVMPGDNTSMTVQLIQPIQMEEGLSSPIPGRVAAPSAPAGSRNSSSLSKCHAGGLPEPQGAHRCRCPAAPTSAKLRADHHPISQRRTLCGIIDGCVREAVASRVAKTCAAAIWTPSAPAILTRPFGLGGGQLLSPEFAEGGTPEGGPQTGPRTQVPTPTPGGGLAETRDAPGAEVKRAGGTAAREGTATSQTRRSASGSRPTGTKVVDSSSARKIIETVTRTGTATTAGAAAYRDQPLLRDPLAARVQEARASISEMRTHKRLINIVDQHRRRWTRSCGSTCPPASTSRSSCRDRQMDRLIKGILGAKLGMTQLSGRRTG